MNRKSLRRKMFALLVIVLFFLLTSLWGFYISVKPGKIVSRMTPRDLGLDYEKVTFLTEDHVALQGWFIRHASAAKTVIALHGYPADKGNILPAIAFLSQRYNLLLFDFRYLGESGGSYSTVGAEETRDLRSAISYLKSRGVNEVGVWGFSLGAAVALMTAADAPEIKAVVSESSYARLDLLTPALYAIPVLKYPLGWLTALWARLFLGVNLKDVSPRDSARKLNIPVLVVHSRDDHLISFQHALQLQEALKDNHRAEFWFHENLLHGQLAAEYQKRIVDFFEKSL